MRKIVSKIYQEVNKNDFSITLKELQNLTVVFVFVFIFSIRFNQISQ